MLDQVQVSVTEAGDTNGCSDVRSRCGGHLPDLVFGIDRAAPPHPQLVLRRRCRRLDRSHSFKSRHQDSAACAVADTYAAPPANRHRRSVKVSAGSPAIGSPSAKVILKPAVRVFSRAARNCGSRNSRTGWASDIGPSNSI